MWQFSKSVVPIAASVGGVAVPAVMYALINLASPETLRWPAHLGLAEAVPAQLFMRRRPFTEGDGDDEVESVQLPQGAFARGPQKGHQGPVLHRADDHDPQDLRPGIKPHAIPARSPALLGLLMAWVLLWRWRVLGCFIRTPGRSGQYA
ncbi:hypothetical protein DAD99_20670 [Pseudarthrobacter sp. AB1]|nr:hypothetical protein [Pseudarthrobacter sp. AB1]